MSNNKSLDDKEFVKIWMLAKQKDETVEYVANRTGRTIPAIAARVGKIRGELKKRGLKHTLPSLRRRHVAPRVDYNELATLIEEMETAS